MSLQAFLLFLFLSFCFKFNVRAQGGLPSSATTAIRVDSLTKVAHVKAQRNTILRVAVPAALVGVGLLATDQSQPLYTVKQDLQGRVRTACHRFDSRGIDDYTRHAPLALAYALMATGHKGERTPVAFTLIYLASHELDEGVVSHLKSGIGEARPFDARDRSSFPSSHTSQAFLTATLLHEQYGHQYPWVSVSGFAVAAATGAMRVMGDKHWVTDVLAGGAIGFASAEAVWRLYPSLTKLLPEKVAHKLLLVPTYVPGGGAGLALAVQP